MRPIDIAKKLNLSTSALRNYEAHGLVPPTERSPSGYRVYTDEHMAYFECIQAMAPGFGMEVTSEVVRLIQQKDVGSAMWRITESQVNLHRDKKLAERNIQMMEAQELASTESGKADNWMTIGKVSAETSIPSSAIRYWEKEGLITSSRDPQNGYRKYNRSQIHKISLLRALRNSIYSPDLVELKNAIAGLDPNDLEHAKKIARESLDYMDKMNQEQLRGVYYFYRLCRLLDLIR